MFSKFANIIYSLIAVLQLNHYGHAQSNATKNNETAQIYRFSSDEKDVEKLYDALARGSRTVPVPKKEDNKIPRLKDLHPQFSERGKWEEEMFANIEEMRKQMQQFFDQGNDPSKNNFPAPKFFPKNFGMNQILDVEDPITEKVNKNGIVYTIDLSKVDPNSLKIEIKGGQVSIAGESRIEKKESGPDIDTTSISISSFNRSFPLPEGVKESAVKIEQKDKVIEIMVPKS